MKTALNPDAPVRTVLSAPVVQRVLELKVERLQLVLEMVVKLE
jgi:hypothetical protein